MYNAVLDCNVIYFISLSDQEPSITEIRPDNGPVFGGTTVTLTGRYLNSGIQRDVFFDNKKCTVQR